MEELITEVFEEVTNFSIRPLQLEALVSFVQYETTIVSLGTGGGKTFIYKVLPDLINKLNPVKFTWKNDEYIIEEKRNTDDIGFIAQELLEILPFTTGKFKVLNTEKEFYNIKYFYNFIFRNIVI